MRKRETENSFLIIGAGIVGLATAIKLQEKFPDSKITIVEKEKDVAQHQTGNNSGVIHSGIYYKPGSLKAVNCVKGYKMLLEFCNNNNVNYNLCGKVIVATGEDEKDYLNVLFERGEKNGLKNLKLLSEDELKEIEPAATGIAGIYVPQTGIIDYGEVSRVMKETLINKGVKFIFNEKVIGITETTSQILVKTNSKNISANFVISCGGLQSDKIALLTEKKLDVRIVPFRGEYYKLKENATKLVNTLIYPVPDPNFPFLGVHFTNLIGGGVEAGPNAVFSFKREGYSRTSFSIRDTVSSFTWPGFLKVAKKYWRVGLGEFYRSFSKKAFVKALQKLIPEIREDDLAKGGAGIRAQACGLDGKLIDDFYFLEKKNIIHVLNAPSPAATSSLAIGEFIVKKVEAKLE